MRADSAFPAHRWKLAECLDAHRRVAILSRELYVSDPHHAVVMLTSDRRIDRRILLEADSLSAAGWRITIVAMPSEDDDASDDPRVVRVRGAPRGARRESMVMNFYRRLRVHMPMNGTIMRVLKRIAWRAIVDPETFYDRLMHSEAEQHEAAVVVAHDLPMLPLAARLAREKRAKLVLDSHELWPEQEFSVPERERWRAIEAKYLSRCDTVMTINPAIAQELERRGAPAPAYVILNAERNTTVPMRTRYFHDHFGLAPDAHVLLYQGGMVAGRNLEMLVAGMRLVVDPRVVLVLLGDGVLAAGLARACHAPELAQRVRLHPAVQQTKLLELTAAADAGVIPYQATCLNNRLCTPNKLFEFVATGVPILASDLPELSRIIGENRIGMLADLSTPRSIAAAIDSFFSDARRLASWRKQLQDVGKNICWEVEEKKLIAIFESLK
jgi:glycosyltransferase involved in cell wall biosynthesis